MSVETKNPGSENAHLNVMFEKRQVVRKGNTKRVRSDDDSSDESDPGTQVSRVIKRKRTNVPDSATSLTNIKASSPDPESAITDSTACQVGKSNIDDATKQSHLFDDQSSRDHDAVSGGSHFGPFKAAPANVRITAMIDYARAVCKDVSPPQRFQLFPILKRLFL